MDKSEANRFMDKLRIKEGSTEEWNGKSGTFFGGILSTKEEDKKSTEEDEKVA